jgi:hypothetical protein
MLAHTEVLDVMWPPDGVTSFPGHIPTLRIWPETFDPRDEEEPVFAVDSVDTLVLVAHASLRRLRYPVSWIYRLPHGIEATPPRRVVIHLQPLIDFEEYVPLIVARSRPANSELVLVACDIEESEQKCHCEVLRFLRALLRLSAQPFDRYTLVNPDARVRRHTAWAASTIFGIGRVRSRRLGSIFKAVIAHDVECELKFRYISVKQFEAELGSRRFAHEMGGLEGC